MTETVPSTERKLIGLPREEIAQDKDYKLFEAPSLITTHNENLIAKFSLFLSENLCRNWHILFEQEIKVTLMLK